MRPGAALAPQPFRAVGFSHTLLLLFLAPEKRIPLFSGDAALDELAFISGEMRERILQQRAVRVGVQFARGDIQNHRAGDAADLGGARDGHGGGFSEVDHISQ